MKLKKLEEYAEDQFYSLFIDHKAFVELEEKLVIKFISGS